MPSLRVSLPYLILLFGAGGLVILIPLALGGFEIIADFLIAFQTRIVADTPTFWMWQKIPVPVYLRVYFFNVTNVQEMEKGAKPLLEEVGPVVYRETLEKFDITFNGEQDTVRYRQVRCYYYEPEMSTLKEWDKITIVNIAFVAVAKMAHEFKDANFLTNVHNFLTEKGERLTKTQTVKEILFDGFPVQNFVDLAESELAGNLHLPESILDGKMGLFEGKNGTDDGWWMVKSGSENSNQFGSIVNWNGMTNIKKWYGPECNTPKGTDGLIFEPFLTKKSRLQSFVPELCRNWYFTYRETIQHGIVTTFRFGHPISLYETIDNNPNNYCYCPYHQRNVSWCPPRGLLSVSPCFEGMPIFMSQPHFLGAYPVVLKMVEGLKPDVNKHWGYFDLHPRTGVSVEMRKKVQLAIEVHHWPDMATFASVQHAYIPIIWTEEGGDIDNFTLNVLKILDIALKGWAIGKWFFLFFELLITGAGIGLLIQQNKSSKIDLLDKSSLKSDDD